MRPIYDRIGVGYLVTRRPDPRIADRIIKALDDSASVVNVGAGAGSYEPRDRMVVSVEPSATMIRQRLFTSAPVVQGAAEARYLLPMVPLTRPWRSSLRITGLTQPEASLKCAESPRGEL